jgi:RNA polymerase sigma factor for flagellar operon FliA
MTKQTATSRDEMILKNKPLVTLVVNRLSTDRIRTLGLERDDAIGYGVEGLIQAVDSFDSSRGTTFASFAVQRIRGSILDAIRREDPLPRLLRRNARQIDQAAQELAGPLGRWPTRKEIAMRLGITPEEVHETQKHAASRFISLDNIIDDRSRDGGSASWDPADADDRDDPGVVAERRASLALLGHALEQLAERDRELLRLRYGESRPFHEVGRILGLSESRACQIHKRVLAQLRRLLVPAMEEAA